MLNCLRKGSNCIFGLCQQTRNVDFLYLAFINLKISNKKGQQQPQSLMQTTNDVFVGQNAAKYVRLMQLQVKLKKITEITYLEENKQETRYRIKHLDVSKEEQTYDDVSKAKESMKIKCYVFSGYKHRNNVCLVYLESQLQKSGYG